MKRALSIMLFCVLGASAANAQTATIGAAGSSGTSATGSTSATSGTSGLNTGAATMIDTSSRTPPVAQLLSQGFEIKAGFFDASSVAYLVLQKGKEAYLCHAGNAPGCDKLN